LRSAAGGEQGARQQQSGGQQAEWMEEAEGQKECASHVNLSQDGVFSRSEQKQESVVGVAGREGKSYPVTEGLSRVTLLDLFASGHLKGRCIARTTSIAEVGTAALLLSAHYSFLHYLVLHYWRLLLL